MSLSTAPPAKNVLSINDAIALAGAFHASGSVQKSVRISVERRTCKDAPSEGNNCNTKEEEALFRADMKMYKESGYTVLPQESILNTIRAEFDFTE